MGESPRIKILANRLTAKTLFLRRGVSPIFKLACSRRSDSRARDKNSRREKNEGRLEGERGRPPSLPPPPIFRVYNLTSLPTYRRALLSERLEKAIFKPKNKGKNYRSKPKETSCLQAWHQWEKPDFPVLETNSNN